LIWCAGALARDYAALGGETFIVGKPHAPIYDAAFSRLDAIAGRRIDPARILAIGDGMPTDVRGANEAGLDLLYISSGIHAAEYGEAENPDERRLLAFLASHGASARAWMPRLVW
jgi:ribonucleotide monophosphatase NagD (HAD superfamily)